MCGDGEKDVEKGEQLWRLQSRKKTITVTVAIGNNIVKHSGIECEWDARADSLRNSVMIFLGLLRT